MSAIGEVQILIDCLGLDDSGDGSNRVLSSTGEVLNSTDLVVVVPDCSGFDVSCDGNGDDGVIAVRNGDGRTGFFCNYIINEYHRERALHEK
jgi:hypothetical protein